MLVQVRHLFDRRSQLPVQAGLVGGHDLHQGVGQSAIADAGHVDVSWRGGGAGMAGVFVGVSALALVVG